MTCDDVSLAHQPGDPDDNPDAGCRRGLQDESEKSKHKCVEQINEVGHRNSGASGREVDDRTSEDDTAKVGTENRRVKQELIWTNIIGIGVFHALALYSYLTYPYLERKLTLAWAYAVLVCAGFGVGGGVHRLWTHRAYKAKTPLRIILLCCYSVAGMNSIYDWVRDHRIHHKFSETDADPHNSNRGFFFSHCGWLMMKKHPEVIRRGRQINMDDVLGDPVVAFGEKYFKWLKLAFCFVLPTVVPVYFWGEDWYYAIISQVLMRYAWVLNATWSINSVAHLWGYRPYDKNIAPVENRFCSYATGGEGWHNYHHVFPWDYKAAEYGHYQVDITTVLIDFFSKVGWAYDLKEPSGDLIRSVSSKKGDGQKEFFFFYKPPEHRQAID